MAQDNDTRISLLEQTVGRLADTQHEISESLKAIVRLETSHQETREGLARAFSAVERNEEKCIERQNKQDERLRLIEEQMPLLKRGNRWLEWAIIAIVTAVGTQGLRAIFAEQLQQVQIVQQRSAHP